MAVVVKRIKSPGVTQWVVGLRPRPLERRERRPRRLLIVRGIGTARRFGVVPYHHHPRRVLDHAVRLPHRPALDI